ncbi:MAG: UvrD-helicase domain-containing protein [Tissierellia bacterium]|nr:UvrD-helicase domain-containing protein [Tissierellia bacterium]
MKLTPTQIQAIKNIDGNMILNAGAGTGKTEVLTRRFMELIRRGVKLEEIVCITFTKKAANEMKERIQRILIEEGQHHLLSAFSKTNISTIHGFCSKILKEYADVIGIDPHFKIMDDQEMMDQFLFCVEMELFDRNLEDFYSTLQIYDYDVLKSEIYHFLIKNKDHKKLKKMEENLMKTLTELPNLDYGSLIFEELKSIGNQYKIDGRTKLGKIFKREDFLKGHRMLSEELIEEFYEAFVTSRSNIIETIQGETGIMNLFKNWFINKDRENIPLYEKTFKIFENILYRFDEYKASRSFIDYDDMELLCYDLLQIDSVKKELQSKYRYLMVDEYQDSSEIQKNIFYALCSKRKPLDRKNLFVVGDPKQSIYAFRGASVNIFYETMEDIQKSDGHVLLLETNFRATKNLMDPINTLFSEIMGDRYDGLKAVTKDEHQGMYITNDGKDIDEEEEARFFSEFISWKTHQGKEFKDFSYLVRASNSFKIHGEYLKQKGIPFYILGSKEFLYQEPIREILAFLSYLLYRDDESLFGIAGGLFYGYSPSDFYRYSQEKDLGIKDIDIITKRYVEILDDSLFRGIYQILVDFKYFEYYHYLKEDIQNQGNLYQLLQLALYGDEMSWSLYDFYHYVRALGKDYPQLQVEDENSNIVRLMTIHKSKGLSIDSVLIPRLGKTNRFRSSRFVHHKNYGFSMKTMAHHPLYEEIIQCQKEEENLQNDNLYYVAMTRAKTNCALGIGGQKSGFLKNSYKKIMELYDEGEITRPQVDDYTIDIPRRSVHDIEKFVITNKKKETKIMDRLNASMLMDYLEEPDALDWIKKQRSREEIQKKDIKSMDGTIVHGFAEIYDGDYGKTIDKLKEKFQLSSRDISPLEMYFKNYIFCNPNPEIGEKEVDFHLHYCGEYLNGIIDRLIIDGQKIKIIDFKLSSIGEEIKKIYAPQLNFYGFAMDQIYPGRKIELEIQNLRNRRVYSLDYDREWIEGEIGDFIAFVRGLE